jgi:hypothetical protein
VLPTKRRTTLTFAALGLFSLQQVHAAACQFSIWPPTKESDRESRTSISGGIDTNRRLPSCHVFLADVPLKMAENNPGRDTGKMVQYDLKPLYYALVYSA